MAEEGQLKEHGSVEKNKNGRFILTTSNWRGSIYADLREYYTTEEDPGKWLPTRKGIRFKKELYPEIVKLLEKLKD